MWCMAVFGDDDRELEDDKLCDEYKPLACITLGELFMCSIKFILWMERIIKKLLMYFGTQAKSSDLFFTVGRLVILFLSKIKIQFKIASKIASVFKLSFQALGYYLSN